MLEFIFKYLSQLFQHEKKDNIRVRSGLGAIIRTTNNERSELELNEVDSDDDDCDIQCALRNEFGLISSSSKIKLLNPPEIRCPSSYKEGLTYDVGDSLRLRVTFTGKPLPKMTVYFKDREIFADDRTESLIQLEAAEIRIKELRAEDSGTYKFIAQNELGSNSLSVDVNVLGPPHPPEGNIIFDCTDENQIVLRWNTPECNGGSDIYNYIVEQKQPENETWFRFGSTHKTMMILGDLNEVGDCLFRVRAENIYGTSEPSKEIKFVKSKNLDVINKERDKNCNPDDTENTKIESSKCVSTHEFQRKSELDESPSLEAHTNYNALRADLKGFVFPSTDVVYAATQTVLSPLVLNFACDCTEMFSETLSFSTEPPPQTEQMVVMYEKRKIYIPRCFDVVFETTCSIPETKDQTGYCNIRFIPETHFIIVNQTETNVPFLCLQNDTSFSDTPSTIPISPENSVLNSLESTSEKCLLIEKKIHHPALKKLNNIWCYLSVDENHTIEFKVSQSDYNCSKIIYEEIEALHVFLHPLIFEDYTVSLILVIPTETCTLIMDSYQALTVSKNYLWETLTEFVILTTNNERTALVTYSNEECDELISMCSVPVRTFKPAMSVLPFKRESKSSELGCQESLDVPSMTSRPIIQKEDTKGFVFEDINIPKVDECLFSYQDEVFKSPLMERDNYFLSESVNLGVEEMTWKCPDWLMNVSPYSIPETVTIPKKFDESPFEIEAEECDLKTTDDKLHVKDIKPFKLKGKSVEELLQLAEEVERSFTQKTEQIESLENILQNEMFSLEKDLEVVNEIHKNLNDSQTLLDCNDFEQDAMDSSYLNFETVQEVKDLIEFNEDIPSTQQGISEPVEYAPEVIVHLQNRVIQSGCRTRLYCSITGDPEPQISWLKNGNDLPTSSRYFCSNLAEFGIYLDIYNAKCTDSGQYTCLARNTRGLAQTQAYLQVIGKREISPVGPTFLTSPDDISVSKGETVILEWKISGTPTPHVVWFKNAEKISTSLRVTTFSNHRGCCRLVLHDVNIYDSAIYSCYVENEAGSSVSTVLLNVSDENTFFSRNVIPPTLPTLRSEEIVSKENSIKTSDDIHDQSPEPREILYSKHSRQKKGLDSLPGPPFAPHVLSSGQTWVILSWSAPLVNGEKRLEYLVERRLLNSTHWREVGRTRSTLYTERGFKGGQSYVFRICAGNSKGWGLPVTLQQPVHFVQK